MDPDEFCAHWKLDRPCFWAINWCMMEQVVGHDAAPPSETGIVGFSIAGDQWKRINQDGRREVEAKMTMQSSREKI